MAITRRSAVHDFTQAILKREVDALKTLDDPTNILDNQLKDALDAWADIGPNCPMHFQDIGFERGQLPIPFFFEVIKAMGYKVIVSDDHLVSGCFNTRIDTDRIDDLIKYKALTGRDADLEAERIFNSENR